MTMSSAIITHTPLEHPPMSASSKRIIQKRWVCDLCKTKWFLNFDEACAHEAVCNGANNNHKATVQVKEGLSQRNLQSKEVIEIVDSMDDSDGSPVKVSESVRRSKRVRTKGETDEVAAVATKQPDSMASDNPNASFFKPRAKKIKSNIKATHNMDENKIDINRQKKGKNKSEETSAINAKRLQKKEASTTKSKSNKSGLSQLLISEHQAASFFAKRKQAQMEERERQKKREEALRFAKKKDDHVACEVGKTDMAEKADIGVRFPKPSHVVQDSSGEEAVCVADAKRRGRGTLNYPHLKVDLTDPSEKEPSAGLVFFGEDKPKDYTPDIYNLFSSIFEASKPGSKKSTPTKLWTDKYSITKNPSSILGSSNRECASKLSQFIEDWKIRRHKSTLVKKSKSKRRKCGYDSDDSFLDDDVGGKTSLFLLTGPTGSGKSRLVHAISCSLDCVVMEINSGEVRGGGLLKKRVLESTQSHSSVALMKKREQNSGRLIEKSARNTEKKFFDEESSSDEEVESSSLTVILIDEVDLLFQEHGDTGFWLALSQLSQKAKSPIVLTATSMPPELLSGNFSFEHIALHRPSIADCCSKMEAVAKMEGMVMKRDMESADLYERLSLIAELCQCDIRRLLNEMQLFHASMDKCPSRPDDLSIFQRGWKAKSISCGNYANVQDDQPVILSIEPLVIPRDHYTIITIQGKNFQGSGPSTLYLGDNICRYFSVVSNTKIVAVCPPLVIPDGVSKGFVYTSTMSNPVYCLSSKFVNVVVQKKSASGLILKSSSCASPHRAIWNLEYDIPIEVSILDQKLSKLDFIRKAKAQKKRLESEADGDFMSSDEEVEFEADELPTMSFESSNKKETESVGKTCEVQKAHLQDIDPQSLLNEALHKLIGEHSDDNTSLNVSHGPSTTKDFDNFAEEMGRMSDVAWLEDALFGLPMLTGAMEGIGSESADNICSDSIPLDPSIDKLSKDSHYKPSLESLCLGTSKKDVFFFGEPDTYMMRPYRQRERLLLKNCELHSRGLGALDHVTETEQYEGQPPDSMDTENLELSKIKSQRMHVKSDDDMFLSTHSLPTQLLLSSMLGKSNYISSIYRPNIENAPWLHLRMQEIWTNAMDIMSKILIPDECYTDPDWNRICFGIRHSGRFTFNNGQLHIAGRFEDETLSLEYLPYLRLIAFYENKMYLASKEIMNDREQNTRKPRSSKRSKARNCRTHYLNEFCGKYGSSEHDLMQLGNSYLMSD